MLADFERLFPENPAFGSVPIDLSQGIKGAEPMLRLIRERSRHVRDLEEQYRAGSIPVASVAVAGGASMFEVWDAFAANPGMPISTATGSAEEFSMAAERIATANLAILDPLMVYAASRLGIDAGLRAAVPRLGITQTTRDLLRGLLDDRRRDLGSRRGTMVWTGEHYVMHERTAEQADALVQQAQAAIAFAEACELIPAEGDRSIVDELRDLWGILPDALLDSALAAQCQGGILISDDAAFRAIAEASVDIRITWAQPVLQHAFRAGRVTPAYYAEAVGKLVDAGYQFTMFGALELTHALITEDWHVRGRVLKLFELMARPSNDSYTVAGVLAELAKSTWLATRGDARYDSVFAALFRVIKAADHQRAEGILSAALLLMRRGFRLRAWQHEWLGTTSLVPAGLVAARALQVPDRVWGKIGRSLRESFARS